MVVNDIQRFIIIDNHLRYFRSLGGFLLNFWSATGKNSQFFYLRNQINLQKLLDLLFCEIKSRLQGIPNLLMISLFRFFAFSLFSLFQLISQNSATAKHTYHTSTRSNHVSPYFFEATFFLPPKPSKPSASLRHVAFSIKQYFSF